MRAHGLRIAAVTIISLWLCVASADAQWARYGKLKGRVTKNGRPVSQLKIEVVGGPETTTDQDGRYAFDHLAEGAYKVIIKDSQYGEHRKTIFIHRIHTTVQDFKV
jgi:hypothetical protein